MVKLLILFDCPDTRTTAAVKTNVMVLLTRSQQAAELSSLLGNLKRLSYCNYLLVLV